MLVIVLVLSCLAYALIGAIAAGIARRMDKIEHDPSEVIMFIMIWPAFAFVVPVLWLYSKVAGEEV